MLCRSPAREAGRAQQERPLGFFECFQQGPPLAVDALGQDEHVIQVHPLLERRVDIAQLTVRGEQHQSPAAHSTRQRCHDLLDPAVEVLVLGRRQVGREADEGLVEEVERRGQDQLFSLWPEADARAEIVEAPAHGQSRRGENRRPALRVHALAQQRPHVDRCRAQDEVLAARREGEPVDAVRVGFNQCLAEQGRGALQPAPDDLQLAHTLVGLRSTQPFTRAAHRTPQHAIERRQRCGRVLSREPYVRPAFVMANLRSKA
jgi:hypothetical protein